MNALNVILVMILRELKMFVSSKSKMFSILAFPVLLTFILKIAFGNANYFGFNMNDVVITGILVSAIAIYSLFGGLSIIWDRKMGFMKELLISPVNKSYILIGKILGISIISFLIGLIIIITNPIKISVEVFIFMFATSLIFSAIGVSLGFRCKDFEDFGNLIYLILTFIILFGGVLTPIGSIPKPWQYLCFLDPLTYPLDGIRYYVVGNSLFNPLIDFIVSVLITLVFLYLAKEVFEKTED